MPTRAYMGQVIVSLPSGREEIMSLEQARNLQSSIDVTCQDMEVTSDWQTATKIAHDCHANFPTTPPATNIDDYYYHRIDMGPRKHPAYIRRAIGLHTYDVVINCNGRDRHHQITV